MSENAIPFYHIIMKCRGYTKREVVLPDGYSIVPYTEGREKDWARLEVAIGDFDTSEAAERRFCGSYLGGVLPYENILFLLSPSGEAIGSCIAEVKEQDGKITAALQWLVVDRNHRGNGLGRALAVAVMNIFAKKGIDTVYLHTQPHSYKAILLYHSLGFRLQKTDSFSGKPNEYQNAIEVLKDLYRVEDYRALADSADE
ncbi:MAG: GNAT family N-acetyltransferase [Clostridia bacterium]|nr:GNAT family N-acetyltransferase [Clostridia bacterium]